MASEDFKDFIVIVDESYHRGNGQALIGDLSLTGAKEELQLTHGLSCGEYNISLYRSTTVGILLAYG